MYVTDVRGVVTRMFRKLIYLTSSICCLSSMRQIPLCLQFFVPDAQRKSNVGVIYELHSIWLRTVCLNVLISRARSVFGHSEVTYQSIF